MENEQQTINQKKCDCGSCWKCRGFFGSKLNTVLLLILIVLMVIALKWMFENKQTYFSSIETATNFKPENNEQKLDVSSSKTWKKIDGWNINYPSNWLVKQDTYRTPAQEASNEIPSVTGYTFTLPGGAKLTIGGRQPMDCPLGLMDNFKYGVSTSACFNGMLISISPQSDTSDIKAFGEFVINNK